MKYIFVIFFVFSSFISCTNQEDKKAKDFDKQTYEQQKESLLDKEKKSPKQFLKITGEDNRNFWGQSVYRGKIENNATQCTYKNIRVKTLYYKKEDGTLITNHEDVFEDEIKPGSTFQFKTKYKTPKGTDSVVASIISAEVAK